MMCALGHMIYLLVWISWASLKCWCIGWVKLIMDEWEILKVDTDRLWKAWFDPNTNISNSPMMGLTHLIHQHFKLAQEIHTSERTVRPEAHTVGSSYIETSNRPYKRHQPPLSYSKSVLTYPKQFYLHIIEYYSISLRISYSIYTYNYMYSKSFQAFLSEMILASEYK